MQLDWVLVRGFHARSFLTDDRRIDGVLPSDHSRWWSSWTGRSTEPVRQPQLRRRLSRHQPVQRLMLVACLADAGTDRQNTEMPIRPSPSIWSGRRMKPIAAAMVANTISTTTATDSPAPGGPGSPTACAGYHVCHRSSPSLLGSAPLVTPQAPVLAESERHDCDNVHSTRRATLPPFPICGGRHGAPEPSGRIHHRLPGHAR